jgi:hypothetical protein
MNRVFVLLGCVWGATACGGSSSETPFPQPPIESQLEARHDAVHAAEVGTASDEAAAPTASATADPVDNPNAAEE